MKLPHRVLLSVIFVLLFNAFVLQSVLYGSEDPDETEIKLLIAGLPELEGIEKVRCLVEIGTFYDSQKLHPQGLPYLEEAHLILQANFDASLLCEIEYLLASAYLHLERKFTALEFAEKSRLKAVRLGDIRLISLSLRMMGNIALTFRKYDEAIDYYNQSRLKANEINDKELISGCLNNIAICYWRMKNWELSEKFLYLAIDQFHDNPTSYHLLLNNIGLVMMEQGRYEEAENKLLAALKYNRKRDIHFSLGLNVSNLAELEERRGNLDAAIQYAEEALAMGNKLNNQYILTRTFRHLAKALIQKGDLESAEVHLKKSLAYSKEFKDPAEQIESYTALIDLYRKQRNFKEALAVYVEVVRLENSINSDQARTRSILFNVRYDTESKEQQIQLLLKEKELAELRAKAQEYRVEQTERELLSSEKVKEYQILLRNWMIVGFLTVGIFAILLLIGIRHERRIHLDLTVQKTLIDETNLSLKNTNEMLKNINMEKDEILGIVAHDLKNPLTSQLGLGQILNESFRELSDTEVGNMTQAIVDSSIQMNQIITHLLEINRLEQGAVSAHFEEVEPRKILANAINNQNFQTLQKHQTIKLLIEDDLPMIRVDPFLFGQVIDNLLSNAVKYSPQFSNTILAVVSIDTHTTFCIEDEGPGISADEQKLLFMKFKTLSNKPTAGESSVGLGLSIVKHLSELMNGEVWCESSLGNGSRFCVKFQNVKA